VDITPRRGRALRRARAADRRSYHIESVSPAATTAARSRSRSRTS